MIKNASFRALIKHAAYHTQQHASLSSQLLILQRFTCHPLAPQTLSFAPSFGQKFRSSGRFVCPENRVQPAVHLAVSKLADLVPVLLDQMSDSPFGDR